MIGWNLFKLMHRLTRIENINLPGKNMCFDQKLNKSVQLLVCASYASQTDLSDFFTKWNPKSVAYIYPNNSIPNYEGGISSEGKAIVRSMNLPKPQLDPLSINRVTVRK